MYFAVAGIIFGGIIFFYRAFVLPLIRLNQLKNDYQSAAQPRLMEQVGENDDEFYQRVERERARFLDSGNKWAVKQIPVIAIPQNQAFTIDWFGTDYKYSTVGLGQMEYHRMAFEIYVQLYEVWSRETSVFGSEKVALANGQKPFDIKQTWTKN